MFLYDGLALDYRTPLYIVISELVTVGSYLISDQSDGYELLSPDSRCEAFPLPRGKRLRTADIFAGRWLFQPLHIEALYEDGPLLFPCEFIDDRRLIVIRQGRAKHKK